MKLKTILISVAAVVAAAGISVGVFFAVENHKMKNAVYSLPDGFTVTAHSGSMGTKDNSIESISVGLDNADITEFDVLLNSEGTAVLAHDPDDDYTATLDEAFATVAKIKKGKINVDIKEPEVIPEIVKLADKHGVRERIFLTGVNEEDVEKAKAYSDGIEYYLNIDLKVLRLKSKSYLDSLVQKVKNASAVGINCKYVLIGPDFVKRFHDEGLLVSLWTAKNKLQANMILSAAPDNITTRIPDVVNSMISEKAAVINK